MEEQRVKVFHAGDDEPSWVTVADYLTRYIGTLVPMSVGQCFRFNLGHQILDIEPRMTRDEVILAAELHGLASVYATPTEGVMLVLPKPVRVDVTFEGNAVLGATGLGIQVKAKPKRRKRKPKPAPTIEGEIAALMAKGELKLEPYQERIATLFEDKTARISMSSRRQHARLQMHAYAKLRAVPGCGLCAGGGIIQQEQIDDAPAEQFCECLLETK